MSSRKIKDLHPKLQPIATKFLIEADILLEGYEAFITDGYRSNIDQTKLYTIGRTEPGTIVTRAKAGGSPHNYGLAIDIAFRRDGTKEAIWSREMYEKLEPLAKSLGLQWGGRWLGFVDNPHYELMGWMKYTNNELQPEKDDMSKYEVFYKKFVEAFRKNKDSVEWGDDKHKPEHLLLEDPEIISRMIDNIALSNKSKNEKINRLSVKPDYPSDISSEVESELPKSYNGYEITGIIIKP